MVGALGQSIVEPGGWADFGDQGHCTASLGLGALQHDPQTDRAEEWVKAHNHYRACHGSGDVVWNPQLAEYAKAWVEKLLQHCDGMQDLWDWVAAAGPGVHRPHDGDCYFQHPKNGENIWTGGGVTGAGGYSFEAGAVTSWYQEVTNACPTRGHSAGCGNGILNHYTAMVWRDVREIGCYIATVDTWSGPFSVASCRYSPGAGRDEFEGCRLPNMNGCDGEQVPALVAGECPRLGGADAQPAALSPAAGAQVIGGLLPSLGQWQLPQVSFGNLHLPSGEDVANGLQQVQSQLGLSSAGAASAPGPHAGGEALRGSGGPQQQGQPQAQAQAVTVSVGFGGFQLGSLHGLTGLSSTGLRLGGRSSAAPALALVVLLMAGSLVAAVRGPRCCCSRRAGRFVETGLLYEGLPLGPGSLPGPHGKAGGADARQ